MTDYETTDRYENNTRERRENRYRSERRERPDRADKRKPREEEDDKGTVLTCTSCGFAHFSRWEAPEGWNEDEHPIPEEHQVCDRCITDRIFKKNMARLSS